MKVEELIAELQKLPSGIEVCIGDYKKHCALATADEPCGEGVYPNFKVEIQDEGWNKPFASLSFDSGYGDDY